MKKVKCLFFGVVTTLMFASVTLASAHQLTEGKITIKSVKTLTPPNFSFSSTGGSSTGGSSTGGSSIVSHDFQKNPEKLEVKAITADGREVKLSTSIFEWIKDAKIEPIFTSTHSKIGKIVPIDFSEGSYFKLTVMHNGKTYECKLGIGSEFSFIENGTSVQILVKGDNFTVLR